ncbi:MAG: hypothetical protein M3Q52_02385 [Pseudomonadota bacterium]|nr:hypothetical protein [Pseudomonadota bacterium]
MRAILLLLIVVVVAAIVLFATGLVDVNTVRGIQAPKVEAGSNGVTARGGQAPAFDVQTGSVGVGTAETTVKVPTIQVRPADANTAASDSNTAAPASNTAAQ